MPPWLSLVLQFAPQILRLNPHTAPIADPVAQGIVEAEQMPGATGAQKLQHVVNIAGQAAVAANNAKGRVVVDPNVMATVAAGVISQTVDTVNLIHAIKHSGDAVPVPTAVNTTAVNTSPAR